MYPKLSICIPTFNRKAILQDSIQDILDKLNEYNLELCISNNNSNDDTKFYLDKINLQNKLIKVVHQEENNGLEQNMIDAMKLAQGDFILPIGDDEKINVDYINVILNELKNDPEILLLNGFHGKDYQLSAEFQNLEFNNPEEAFPILWKKMQPGAFIVKRDLLFENRYLKYLGTSHAYSGWVLDCLFEKYKRTNKVLIKTSQAPLITFKQEVKTWRNNAFKITYYEIPLWLHLLSEKYTVIHDENILKIYLKKMSSLQTLIYFRLTFNDFDNYIKKFMEHFEQSQKKKASFIAKIPKAFLYPYYFGIVYIKKLIKWLIR